MKFLLLIFITFIFAEANEIQRVDDILKDINELRAKNQECQNNLDDKILMYQNKILKLENIIKKQKKMLKPTPECEEQNSFPKLKMKENAKIQSFKASAFRTNKLAPIYSDLKGKVIIDEWEKDTSFTSSQRTSSMIKITGYFIDKVWTKAKKDMWIKVEDSTKR